METILVTGGAGFIGSHLCDRLLLSKKVICIDDFNDYYSPEIKRLNVKGNLQNRNYSLEEGDIKDYDFLKRVFDKYKPVKIVHLAARAGVRSSIDEPFIYEETNVKGTLNLLELSKIFKIRNFVFGSSSSVYGMNNKIPFSETDRTDNPISPYAATKKSAEVLCYTYSYLHNLNITCLRFFTVYGPRGRPDMAPFIFTRLISNNQPITMYGDGTSRRDYTYIGDIIDGIAAALEKDLKFEIFNLGNSNTVELKELISAIESQVGKKAIIIKKDMPKGDVLVTYADITKAKKLLGFSPKIGIIQGIKMFVEWFKENDTLNN